MITKSGTLVDGKLWILANHANPGPADVLWCCSAPTPQKGGSEIFVLSAAGVLDILQPLFDRFPFFEV
jgi:hypothetical protein